MSVDQFFIKRISASGYVQASDKPEACMPVIGFIYVTSGEVLVQAGDMPFLCQPGQILLVPRHYPFKVMYYRDVEGYKGGFEPSALASTQTLKYLSAPLHQGFWFDEGAFMGELFNMLAISCDKGDRVFVEKGLDLLLSRIRPSQKAALPSVASRFLESVFNADRVAGTIASYAAETGVSENYLSRLVKNSTGHSVGAWISIVRVQRAKRMLADTLLPIIDIAAAVGMEDQSYFSRFFKKETGMTPSEYRAGKSAPFI